MTQTSTFIFTGKIETIDNSKNGRPFKFSARDNTNQVMYFGSFDATHAQIIQQNGVGSGDWNITYVVKPWTGSDGIERYNNNVQSISGQATPSAPVPNNPINPPQPPPQPQTQAPQPTHLYSLTTSWADNMDDRGRSIIRQVAFKDVPNKDDKSLEEINNLTNAYEAILLMAFEPSEDYELTADDFIQQADDWN